MSYSNLDASREALVSPTHSAHDPASLNGSFRSQRISLTRGDSSRSEVSRLSRHTTSLPAVSMSEGYLERPKHPEVKTSVSEKQERDKTQKKCRHFNSHHWWLFEVGAEIVAFISLGMMLLVLWYYNGKPVAQWQYSHVTLNGVVSFLATVARTGLMVPVSAAIGQRKWLRYLPGRNKKQRSRQLQDFETFDDASRGSLGSLKLMWAVRFWDVACIGALITILSVLFDAMAQNVLATGVRMENGAGEGLNADRVPRSEIYNLSSQSGLTGLTMPSQFSIAIESLAAIYNGLLSNTVPDVQISCATGNCTWPVIPTVAMCGACMDLKSQVLKTCDIQQCTWQMPGGLNISRPIVAPDVDNYDIENPQFTPIFKAAYADGQTPINESMTGSPPPGDGLVFQFIGQSFGTFMAPNWGGFAPGAATPFNISSIVAKECGIWYCVQARGVNASMGIVTDTVLQHWNSPDANASDPTQFATPPESFNVRPQFAFHGGNPYDLESSLKYSLTGEINIDGHLDIGYNMTAHYIDQVPRLPSFGVDILHAAWNYADDLDGWWANLAKSLTNTIRTKGYVNETEDADMYAGIAWKAVTFYQVRWEWLVLPVVLVAASAVFLFITLLVASRGGNGRSWKNRVLPVLFAGMDEDKRETERVGLLDGKSDFKDAGKQKVFLDLVDEEWVFRAVEDH